MISSSALRKISARSRGLRPVQPSKAASAASIAALASSTVALATDAILRSVAGSITSKRTLSDDLRHWPPIHRSVGTLARRFSYMMRFPSRRHSGFGAGAPPRNDERTNSPTIAAPYRRFDPASATRRLPQYRRPAAEYAAW